MKLLMVAGTAGDIFIHQLALWLRKSMEGLEIDVFECKPESSQGYDGSVFSHVGGVRSAFLKRLPLLNRLVPFHEAAALRRFLRGRRYDVIHCHWIRPVVVLSRFLRAHCRRLYWTFWGGELSGQTLLYSRRLYLRELERALRGVDCVVNSQVFFSRFRAAVPGAAACRFKAAGFGSAAFERIRRLRETEPKEVSVRFWSLPENKKTLLLGYSGKELHNHLGLLAGLERHGALEGRVHLLVPMTRGAKPGYVARVEKALEKSGFSYTLLKDRFLTDEEVARLRIATDIVLQLSDSDGFSRSIVECLSASAILIYGTWLDYGPHLAENGFSALPAASVEEGIALVEKVLDDYGKYAAEAARNSRIRTKYLWSEAVRDWVDLYREPC